MHLQKWGNSFGVRVPLHYLKQLHLSETDPLEMVLDLDGESIIIRKKPTLQEKKYDLKSLLAQIKEDHQQEEAWEDDGPKGNEIW
jgi:antitoxin MazE